MPLERVEIRNEYGFGKPELYKGIREDPKAVFDGVAVAGLVGILRQLGDLAEFAAEVFHGLQEEVMTTAYRSRKLVVRAKQIESELPTLEKLALAQKSHLHFCYTAGTDWHVHLQNQHNHFIHGELPKFIMDSYEECREPPRLHMLDKFDSNGPGSCLKKYSDPTFFKKASPIFDEAAERAEKDKKHRRRKKKRQGQKNREVHNLSISDGIARMQLVPPTESPAHCISTNKTSFESGQEGRSESFELRTGLDYIDCVFDNKPSAKAEEEKLMEPQSSQFTLQPCDNSDISDNHDKAEDDEYHHKSSLQYEPSSSSTRVSWEEKMEIVNCKDYECLPDEATESVISDTQDDAVETTATNLCHIDQIHFTSDVITNEHMTLPEDIQSDAEDFMDALNTIESETEFESDYQAKQEVERSVPEVNIPEVSYQSSHEPTTLNSLHGTTSPSKPSSDSPDTSASNGYLKGESPQFAAKHNVNNSGIIIDGSHSDAANTDALPTTVLFSQDLRNFPSEKLMNGVHDTESPSGSSEKSSVTFWTNGGLLGLQPSKPTDFKASSGANRNHKKDETPSNAAENGQNATSRSDELIDVFKSSLTNISPQDKASGASRQELDNAPPMSGLAYRLFSNSFQRKIPSIHDYRGLPIGSPEDDCVEQKTVTQKSFPERSPKKLFTTSFDINSPSSSPPLEHMKISFLPMGAAEASRLKLKFHDEEVNHEQYGDMLPSFQLVPDTSVHPHENVTDSDDDTFCRSPQSGSGANLNYHSESSSGGWESSETPKSNEHQLYDDLCRMPSAESSSCYQDDRLHEPYHFDRANSPFIENRDKPVHVPSNGLPSFDVIKSSVVHNTEFGADSKGSLTTLHFPNEATPSLPPLPPSQWISSKLRSDLTNDRQDVPAEDLSNAHRVQVTCFASLEQQNLLSTWQPKILEVPTNQHEVQETTVLPYMKKLQDQRKVFGKAKVHQAANEFDDKDDFLQQIRAQSFNLRRTSLIASTRSNSMPAAPITNAKVTAILEKANAIRQVMASDDGEGDDTWSE